MSKGDLRKGTKSQPYMVDQHMEGKEAEDKGISCPENFGVYIIGLTLDFKK